MSAVAPERIDVVILCGGLGKRLQSVVSDRPKPMAEINGRPFLDILIDHTAAYGFVRYILCIGHMGDFIKRHYRQPKSGVTVLFSEEHEPLGTGGAVKHAAGLIQSSPFLVMNGDSFCDIDLCEFAQFHTSKQALLSIVLVNAEEQSKDCGIVTLDSSCRVTGFSEKPQSKHTGVFASAGIYLCNTEILSLMPPTDHFSLEYDLLPVLADKGFFGYVTGASIIDIGTPTRYAKAGRWFAHA